MIRIPLDFSINRDLKTGKKFYTDTQTKQRLTKPKLPKGWQTATLPSPKTPSYAIVCGDDLIVVDCDDITTTQMMDDSLVPTEAGEADHYVAISDKGFKHFYFRPTEYFTNSILAKGSRVAIGKIDLLQGRALVFTPCALNKTKEVHQGSEDTITPIPDNIVDMLSEQLGKTSVQAQGDDYAPLTSYLAPTITQALALYERSKDYRDLQNLMMLITPSSFKHALKPDFHPDRVPEGEGIAYLQAITAKIGRDPSISLKLHIELLSLITQQLWASPLSDAELKGHTDSILTQTYSGTGKKVFTYNSEATSIPLASINGNPFMPIYRTLDDQYILAKPQGGVEVIKGLSNFKRAMLSKNYKMIVDSVEINNAAYMNKAVEGLDTVTIKDLTYHPPGVYSDDGSMFYNIYTPNRFLGIIRTSHLQERVHKNNSTPTIDRILLNLVCDHPDPEEMVSKFEQFLAHKLKTLDYSPIVFQIMGNRGVGKGLLMQLLELVTNATARMKLTASNNQFNADTAGKMFVNEDEGIVTAQVINSMKELSGNQRSRIEGKGIDAYMARNVATYIATTNKTTPLAETVDDRRFVTFSSFKGKRLEIDYNRLQLEVEEWCLRLRDTRVTNQRLYVDANAWHDEVHYEAFREKSEDTEHGPSKLAHLIYTIDSLTGKEIKDTLEEALGEYHYQYIESRQTLWIPLSKQTKPIRVSDNERVPHDITHSDLRKVELGEHLSEDKNNSVYTKRYWRLRLQLTKKQGKAFEDIESIVGEDIDLGD